MGEGEFRVGLCRKEGFRKIILSVGWGMVY